MFGIKRKQKKRSRTGPTPFWGDASLEDSFVFERAFAFVKYTIDFLKAQKACDNEGIFRKAGHEKRVAELAKLVAKHREYSYRDDEDVHTVATLLKRYFREMQAPILTFELYPTFIAADSEDDEDVRQNNIRRAVGLLPTNHRAILELLFNYLHELSLSSAKTFMDSRNLAIVFGPNLLRPKNETALVLISDAGHVADVTASLIENPSFFFAIMKRSNLTETLHFRSTMAVRYQAHRSNTVRKLDRVMTLSRLQPNELTNQMDALGKRIKSGHIEELFKGVQVAVPAKSRSGDLGARLFATESNETPDFVESGSTVNEETEEDEDSWELPRSSPRDVKGGANLILDIKGALSGKTPRSSPRSEADEKASASPRSESGDSERGKGGINPRRSPAKQLHRHHSTESQKQRNRLKTSGRSKGGDSYDNSSGSTSARESPAGQSKLKERNRNKLRRRAASDAITSSPKTARRSDGATDHIGGEHKRMSSQFDIERLMTNLGQVKDYLNDADDEEVKQAPSDDEEDEHIPKSRYTLDEIGNYSSMARDFRKFLAEKGHASLTGALELLVEIHLFQTSDLTDGDLCLPAMAIFGLCGIGDEPVVDIPLDTLNQLTASDDFTLDMFKPIYSTMKEMLKEQFAAFVRSRV